MTSGERGDGGEYVEGPRGGLGTSLDDVLKDVLSNVNDWLRFAEAKNGALAGIALAVSFGIGGKDIQDGVLLGVPASLVNLSVFLLLTAVLVALASFVPKLTLLLKPKAGGGNSNILYFGHIAGFDDVSYLKRVQGDLDIEEVSGLARAYANQIVTNSQIAVGKYRLFTLGFWLLVAGVALPVVVKVAVVLKEVF